MKKLFILFVLLLLVGCSKDEGKLDIKKLMKENEYIIVDVRTKSEYDESHIKDAINIPHDDIDENITIDKDKIIFVYCASGMRSNVAYKKLSSYGYEVYDLGSFNTIDLPKN